LNAERWSSFHTVLTAATIALFAAAVFLVCSGCVVWQSEVAGVARIKVETEWLGWGRLIPSPKAEAKAVPIVVPAPVPAPVWDGPPGALPPPPDWKLE
jgi:hypothetical protein